MEAPEKQSEWSRARGLLADLKTAARKSVSAQILLGKELSLLKKKLGFTHGSQKRFSPKTADCGLGDLQGVTENETPKTWVKWCESQLSISDDTADRYIACFEYALERAKVQKSKEPEAFRLLVTPADELTGDELELLADHVGRLVRWDDGNSGHLTQSRILAELGIVKTPKGLQGGDTSGSRKPTDEQSVKVWAHTVFGRMVREYDGFGKSFFRAKDAPDYRLLLSQLPIDSPDEGEPSLIGIKECLEGILNGVLSEALKDVNSTIEAKMHGTPPKSRRKKALTTSSK